MNERLIHCYQNLNKKLNLKMNEEEFTNAVKLMGNFIGEYEFAMGNAAFVEDSFYILLSKGDTEGYIQIDADGIYVEIDKPFFPELVLKEYIDISKDDFEGRFADFAPNESDTLVTVNNQILDVKGSPVLTDFNSKGAYLDNTFVEYTATNDVGKLEEAMRMHCENGRKRYNEFLIYDELNIKKINIIDETFGMGRGKSI